MSTTHRPIGDIVRELDAWIKASHMTQAEIAQKAGISQSTVNRLLWVSDRRSRLTTPLLRLCNIANIDVLSRNSIHPKDNKDLMLALEAVWDGTPKHARWLAKVIRQLGRREH